MDQLSEIFLKYDYAEAKDLCKQFLTTVVALLVFSFTFGEKIINAPAASRRIKRTLLCSWCALMASIIACGTGLAYISVAAGRVVYGQRTDYEYIGTVALGWIGVAGALFTVGLLLMLIAAAVSVWRSPTISN